MEDEFELSCGTPSKKVVTAGLPGLEPMPRNRGLLSFRAVNSVKLTFGAKIPASLTIRMPARSMVSAETAVTLTGSLRGSSGSFCAVTVTDGSVTRTSGSSGDCAAGVDCPAADARDSTKLARNTNTTILFMTLILGL